MTIISVRLRCPAIAAILYALLTVAVLLGWPRTPDRAVSDALRTFGRTHQTLIDIIRVLTDAGSTIPFLAVGLTLGATLLVRRKRREAGLTLSVTVLIPILWSLSHWLVPHSRPPDGFIHLTSYGFPSGHTANATAAALVAVRLLGSRRLVRGCAIGFVVFVGMSRVLLLAHYPSQVIGGVLLSAAVVPVLAGGWVPLSPAGRARPR
ncbi:phosphatase PAP2 family protein [Actinoplanes sp. NPDC049265]|uniref:phosphatase PAP2 family protein n=1 Tax=Actinoplanes sp. NPDC049265 TaxID=3363902 RepID=UPI00371513DD